MRVVWALVGSRGDVQPALPVAAALLARGHDVVVGVPPNLLEAAERQGLPAVPLGIDSRALLGSDLVRRDLRARDPRRRLRALRRVSTAGWDELRTGLLPLAEDADLLVTGLLGQEVAAAVTERLGNRFAALHWCPVRVNGATPLLPRGGPRVQRAAWRAGEGVRRALTRREEDRQRTLLGLAPTRVQLPDRLRERGVLEIQAYDGALVPGLAEEWGARRPLVGFPGVATGVAEPADDEVLAWCAAGPSPVYVGFGSMPVRDPAALLAAVAAAGAALGVRMVVSSGWNDLGGVTGHGAGVRVVGAVDHARVLPACRAAVHHGGAGTTAAVLRAGLPAVVGWFSADQPVWGRLLEARGVGVARRFTSLDGPTLTTALERVLDPAVAARARALGGRLVAPDAAVAACVDLLTSASR